MTLASHQRLVSGVRVFDVVERSAWTPDVDDLPWIVLWICSRYNEKHRLTLARRPNLDVLRDALAQFRERCRWRMALRDEESALPSVRVCTRTTPKCSKQLDGEISAWTNCFVTAMHHNAISACTNFRGWRQRCQELLGLLHLARRTVKHHKLHLLPADKEPCLVVLTEGEFLHEIQCTFGRPWYEEVCPLDLDHQTLTTQYRSLCRKVAKLQGEPSLAGVLCRSLTGGAMAAVLQMSVKTHRPDGDVDTRGI